MCTLQMLNNYFSGPPIINDVPPLSGYSDLTMDNNTTALAQIECYTTRSPATNVTWMRNGEVLTIDGVKYDAMQIVTDRIHSSYRNILLVNDVLSIVGNLIFSCNISNINGSTSLSIPTNITGKGSI